MKKENRYTTTSVMYAIKDFFNYHLPCVKDSDQVFSEIFDKDILIDVTLRYFFLLTKYHCLKEKNDKDQFMLTYLLQKGLNDDKKLYDEDKDTFYELNESGFKEVEEFISMVQNPDTYKLLPQKEKKE